MGNKIMDVVREVLDMMPAGTTFGYKDLGLPKSTYVSAAKAMERLIKQGAVNRVSNGVFYKPKKSMFGDLKPSEQEILKHYLFRDGKRVGYITGASLYNRLGLTTQIPKTIFVACTDQRINKVVNGLEIRSAKSYVEVTDSNYRLLELLDAIKDFSSIPDLDPASGLKLLTQKLIALSIPDRMALLDLALKYPPRARALLGMLLDKPNDRPQLTKLRDSLNPFTTYQMGISSSFMPQASQWNIC